MTTLVSMALVTDAKGGLLLGAARSPLHTDGGRLASLVRNRAVIAGRVTFETMHTMLPRDCWLLVPTRDPDLLAQAGERWISGYGYWYVPSVDAAMAMGRQLADRAGSAEVIVAGGASVLEQVRDVAGRAYLTVVRDRAVQQATVPGWDLAGWRVDMEDRPSADDGTAPIFRVLERPARSRA